MVLVSKFLLHLPLNRLYAREGVELDESTLADWVGSCVVALDPIVQSLRNFRNYVLSAERIHADDTTIPVLASSRPSPVASGPMSATTVRSVGCDAILHRFLQHRREEL
jgi:hypothetical protein